MSSTLAIFKAGCPHSTQNPILSHDLRHAGSYQIRDSGRDGFPLDHAVRQYDWFWVFGS